jgi:hypothetical protein
MSIIFDLARWIPTLTLTVFGPSSRFTGESSQNFRTTEKKKDDEFLRNRHQHTFRNVPLHLVHELELPRTFHFWEVCAQISDGVCSAVFGSSSRITGESGWRTYILWKEVPLRWPIFSHCIHRTFLVPHTVGGGSRDHFTTLVFRMSCKLLTIETVLEPHRF